MIAFSDTPFAGTQWGNKKYMNMKLLGSIPDDAFMVGEHYFPSDCKPICTKLLTVPTLSAITSN